MVLTSTAAASAYREPPFFTKATNLEGVLSPKGQHFYKEVERAIRVETETIAMSLLSFGFSSSKRGAAESRSETESPSTDADCLAGQPSASAELERPAAKEEDKSVSSIVVELPGV